MQSCNHVWGVPTRPRWFPHLRRLQLDTHYQKGQMQQHRVPIWSLHFMCVRYPSTVQRQIERYAMRRVTRHICKNVCIRFMYLCM